MSGSDKVFGLPEPSPASSRVFQTPAEAARAAAGRTRRRADAAPSGSLQGESSGLDGQRKRRGSSGGAGPVGPDGAGPDGSQGAPERASQPRIRLLDEQRRSSRRKTAVVGAALALLVASSLCITGSTPMFVSPIEVVQCYGLRLRQLWMFFFDPANLPASADIMRDHPLYPWTLTNFGITFVYVICGGMLALAGALYQNVFRNPIAAPSMLGVSSGIQLGIALLLLFAGTAVGFFMVERAVIAYVSVCVVLAALFGLTWLMTGKGKPFNVTNMLLTGVILNQLVGVVVTYITWFLFDEELYDIFVAMTTMVQPATDPASWAFLLAGFLVAFVPAFVLRFRLNALSFSPGEARMFGVRTTRLQVVALVCGTIAMVTAQLQVGMVAMVTLVVPHISRAVFGSEFRKQFAGTMLIGAAVLVLCHIVVSLISIPYEGSYIPLGVVVNLVLLPAFVWMIATQQRRWD